MQAENSASCQDMSLLNSLDRVFSDALPLKHFHKDSPTSYLELLLKIPIVQYLQGPWSPSQVDKLRCSEPETSLKLVQNRLSNTSVYITRDPLLFKFETSPIANSI